MSEYSIYRGYRILEAGEAFIVRFHDDTLLFTGLTEKDAHAWVDKQWSRRSFKAETQNAEFYDNTSRAPRVGKGGGNDDSQETASDG